MPKLFKKFTGAYRVDRTSTFRCLGFLYTSSYIHGGCLKGSVFVLINLRVSCLNFTVRSINSFTNIGATDIVSHSLDNCSVSSLVIVVLSLLP